MSQTASMAKRTKCVKEENRGLVNFLTELKSQANDTRQASAYHKAVKGIQECEIAITNGNEARQLVKGIGPVLQKKIDNFFGQKKPVATQPKLHEDADKENRTANEKEIVEEGLQEETSKKETNYAPRPNTSPWILLKAFATLGDLQKAYPKEKILEQVAGDKSKSWKSMAALQKRGMIVRRGELYQLSEYGIKCASKLQGKISTDADLVVARLRRVSLDEPVSTNTQKAFQTTSKPKPQVTTLGPNLISPSNKIERVVLLIDNREMQYEGGKKQANIKQMIQNMNIECDSRNLAVGDMLWIGISTDRTEFVLDYIIERKAIADLYSSILDGRYVEQKFRLKKSQLKNIIYLLEGNPNEIFQKSGATFSALSLQKALCSTQVNSSFHIKKTKDLQGTARYLASISKILCKRYVNSHNVHLDSGRIYSHFHEKMLKNSSLTVRDNFAKQLLQIKGCSPAKANAILNVYPTLPSLLEKYSSLDNKASKSLFSNLSVADRRIGPKLSEKIAQVYIS